MVVSLESVVCDGKEVDNGASGRERVRKGKRLAMSLA